MAVVASARFFYQAEADIGRESVYNAPYIRLKKRVWGLGGGREGVLMEYITCNSQCQSINEWSVTICTYTKSRQGNFHRCVASTYIHTDLCPLRPSLGSPHPPIHTMPSTPLPPKPSTHPQVPLPHAIYPRLKAKQKRHKWRGVKIKNIPPKSPKNFRILHEHC